MVQPGNAGLFPSFPLYSDGSIPNIFLKFVEKVRCEL